MVSAAAVLAALLLLALAAQGAMAPQGGVLLRAVVAAQGVMRVLAAMGAVLGVMALPDQVAEAEVAQVVVVAAKAARAVAVLVCWAKDQTVLGVFTTAVAAHKLPAAGVLAAAQGLTLTAVGTLAVYTAAVRPYKTMALVMPEEAQSVLSGPVLPVHSHRQTLAIFNQEQT